MTVLAHRPEAALSAAPLPAIRTTPVVFLTFTVLPAGTDPCEICLCGGLLGQHLLDGRDVGLLHIDGCLDCWSPGGGWLDKCPSAYRHKICTRPEAEGCEHTFCSDTHDLYGHPCGRGHAFCCGCCHWDSSC